MRTPKYLSSSSLSKWHFNKEEFYLQYLADNRPPRFKQTQPMSIGSAFDAYVKCYYSDKLGLGLFEFDKLFEDQVESHNRDWARVHGKYAFESYKHSGALADLLVELEKSKSTPRFEYSVQEIIGGVPILGKPDLSYHAEDMEIVLDWKVNGYCSKYPKSPNRSFIRCRNGFGSDKSQDMHKDCHPMIVNGIKINTGEFLETINKDWAQQLSTYGWLLGIEVGKTFICALDQLACSQSPEGVRIRVAEHRNMIGESYQRELLARYQELWEICNNKELLYQHIPEERCEMLDKVHLAYSEKDATIQELTGR